LKRWLVAYWCSYDCGFACYASDFHGITFWDIMMKAARNETTSPIGGRWPRAKERRHWRGAQSINCVLKLAEFYVDGPERMVDYISGETLGVGRETRQSFKDVMRRVQSHYLFGPWIAFKAADMIERVMGYNIEFSGSEVFMYSEPYKGALMALDANPEWWSEVGEPKQSEGQRVISACENLQKYFSDFDAPPHNSPRQRKVGVQEIETILCCWKSHVNGHYPVYNDLHEIRSSVEPWASKFSTARKFLEAFPPIPVPFTV
jgi:hypothetical protein